MTTNKTIEKILKEFDEKFCKFIGGTDVYVQDQTDGLHKRAILENKAEPIKDFLKHSIEQAVKEREEEIKEIINAFEHIKVESGNDYANSVAKTLLKAQKEKLLKQINELNK